jgi:hypothetical protein
MVPPSSQLCRFLACLRHVHGFPVFGLLRRLRPLDSPSPVSVASPAPLPGSESGFPCSSSRPSSRRWHTLPLAIRSDDLGEGHRRWVRYPDPSVENFKPHQLRSHKLPVPSDLLRKHCAIQDRGFQRMLRCLTIRCLVARHIDDGDARYSSVRQLYQRNVGTRHAWTDPFNSGSFLSRTALQRPVKSQQAERLDP